MTVKEFIEKISFSGNSWDWGEFFGGLARVSNCIDCPLREKCINSPNFSCSEILEKHLTTD